MRRLAYYLLTVIVAALSGILFVIGWKIVNVPPDVMAVVNGHRVAVGVPWWHHRAIGLPIQALAMALLGFHPWLIRRVVGWGPF